MNPYHEAGMYSFLDSSKYATLNMYKASSCHNHHLTFPIIWPTSLYVQEAVQLVQSACFTCPPIPLHLYLQPLAPPLRIPTATVAPTALSPMMHHQDKTIQNIGPRIHHEPSAFGQQSIHQQTQPHHQSPSDRQHSSSGNSTSNSKSTRTPSSKNTSSTSSNVSNSSSISVSCSSSSIVSVDSCPSLAMQPPRPTPRSSQPPAAPTTPLPHLLWIALWISKSLCTEVLPPPRHLHHRFAHPVYISSMSKELRSPIRPTSQKPKAKEATMESNRGMGNERKSSSSPVKTSSEKPPQQGPITKDPADKPLDLSAKIMDFEGPTNGYPPKLEALAKHGYSPTARYGLPPNRELLKETLSPSSSSVSSSSKTPERPEIISTLPSSWVVPSPTQTISSEASQSKGSSIIKNKNLEHVVPQSRSSSCPRIDDQNNGSIPRFCPYCMTTASRPSSVSPSPKINGEWLKSVPTPPEKNPTATKPSKTLKKPETPEIGFKPQQSHLENGHAPSHLYMPQGETYLPHSLAYTNRYLSYPVPESLSLSHLQLSGKGPVYPHPVLLGTNSLYSARLPPKPGIPYGIPPSHGEYLTYHDSQEMVHPLMSPHLPLDHKVTERLELRHRPLDKSWHHNEAPYKCQSITDTDPGYKSERVSERQEVLGSKSQSKPHIVNKEEIVCIDPGPRWLRWQSRARQT